MFEVKGAGTAGVSPAFSINGSAPANSAVVDSNGRLGLGTSSPSYLTEIVGGTDTQETTVLALRSAFTGANTSTTLRLSNSTASTGGAGIAEITAIRTNSPSNGATDLVIKTSSGTVSNERARIDSSGRLLVGTSTAFPVRVGITAITPHQQLAAGNSSASTFVQGCANTTDASAAFHWFAKFASGTIDDNTTAVNADETLGTITWSGSDGTNQTQAAHIRCQVDGTPGANDMPGRLVFSTTADGASSPTEAMRIDSSKKVWVSDSFSFAGSFASTSRLKAYTNTASNTGAVAIECAANSADTRHHITFANSNGAVGSISTNASATAYNTSSDYRLKENVVLLTGAIDRLQQIPVHRFNFIADPDIVVDGFIAHEAQEVVPECVTGTKDEVDEDGNPVYQGIDQSKLVPLLTAALQEAIAEIASLKDRVAVLEAS
jgi:hypothetical protein